MKPLDGDAAVLLRAGRRCRALALELDQLEKALSGAADNATARWSGTAAASFSAVAHAHRGAVQGARIAVERLGALTNNFAHELSDAQAQARRLPEDAAGERKAIEDRINVLRRRFQQQSLQVESELKQLLLRRPVDLPRWTGPIHPPADWAPPTSVRLLPAPVEPDRGAAQLPWVPPWSNGSGQGSVRTLVQPVRGRA